MSFKENEQVMLFIKSKNSFFNGTIKEIYIDKMNTKIIVLYNCMISIPFEHILKNNKILPPAIAINDKFIKWDTFPDRIFKYDNTNDLNNMKNIIKKQYKVDSEVLVYRKSNKKIVHAKIIEVKNGEVSVKYCESHEMTLNEFCYMKNIFPPATRTDYNMKKLITTIDRIYFYNKDSIAEAKKL